MIYKAELLSEYAILSSKFIRLSGRYSKEILRGFCNEKNSQALKIMAKYLDIICHYEAFDAPLTYAQVFTVLTVGSGSADIVIDVGGTTYTYTGSDDEQTIIEYFQNEFDTDPLVVLSTEVRNKTLYVWSYDTSISNPVTTITTTDEEIFSVSNTDVFLDAQPILSLYNCITDVQLEKIINHAYDLTKKF